MSPALPPLCEMKATGPGSLGKPGMKLSPERGTYSPMQFGPTMRIPDARRRAPPRHHLRLHLRQLLAARLAETGGEEVDRADALGDGVVHEARNGAGGH